MQTDPGSDARRVPDRNEIKSLLEKYFAGPITDAQVDAIEKRVQDTAKSVSKHKLEMRTYYSNAVRYRGRAWREELSHGQTAPRMVDLVPWFASITSGFPPPRPYCPDPYVGRWEDVEAPQQWELHVDGAFRTTQQELASQRVWCVVRSSDAGHAGDEIQLRETQFDDAKRLVIRSVTPSELVLDRFGGGTDRTFRLRRTS